MGLIQLLGSTFLHLVQGLLMPRSARLMQHVMKLVFAGRSAEAVAIFEKDAGVTSDLYADRRQLGNCLRQRVAGEDPNIAALYIKGLTWALWKADRSKDALAVVEADFGIEADDYREQVRLAARLQARLAPLEPEAAVLMIQSFSETLGFVDRQADRLAVWEADLGLERGAGRENILEAVQRRVVNIRDPETVLIYVFGIFGAFMASGRIEEASFVLHKYLRIEEVDYLNPKQLLAKIPGSLDPLDNFAAAIIVSLAATQLARGRSIRLLLEALLNLDADSYYEAGQLATRLKIRLTPLLPGWTWNLISLLMVALIFEERDRDALAVGQAAVRFSFGGETEAAVQLGAMLRERRDALSEERLLFFVGMLSMALLDMEQPQEAVALLEGFADLHPEDYQSTSALENRLAMPLERWQVGLSGGFLSTLFRALRAAGEKKKAALLVDVYVARFGPRTGFEGLDFVPGLLLFFEAWLDYFGLDPERHPLEVCRNFVLYLRQRLEFRGVSLGDRTDFITQTVDLRRRVVETGLFWAEWEGDPELARRIALDVLLWDAELMQRLLIERFLLEPILAVPLGKMPSQDWPRITDPVWPDSDYLPDEALTRRAVGALEEDIDSPSLPQETSGAAARLQMDRPDLFQKARDIVRQGVDKARLAESIGSGGLLLRAMFGSQGQLLWFILRSDGQTADVIAKGVGAPGDLERLRWAAARHDFRMALAKFQPKRNPGIRETVRKDVHRALEDLLALLPSSEKPESLTDQVQNIIDRYITPEYKYREAFLRLLAPVLGSLDAPSDPKFFTSWTRNAIEHLREFRDQLTERPTDKIQPALNQITSDYIEEVGRIWKLEVIAAVLSPELDLVVQVDDALHTVPIAHLLVGGEPLFRGVRSIRSSLAPLMSSLQLESEHDTRRGQGQPERLLSLSYFKKDDDDASEGAIWLRRGFYVLARKLGLEAYGATDNPAGSVGLLRKALENLQSFQVLAICGHGDLYRSGIQLLTGSDEADEGPVCLWDGGGCDLSGVDWLWMVSCSIGRLSQNGDRDVEGFCVRLAVHRARSAAAFRWPVHSLEAVALVNESVRLYLEALQDRKATDLRCLRARALNDARKSFFGDGVNPPLQPHVGLNTAAACELFGLG